MFIILFYFILFYFILFYFILFSSKEKEPPSFLQNPTVEKEIRGFEPRTPRHQVGSANL